MRISKKIIFIIILLIAALGFTMIYTMFVGNHYTLHTSCFYSGSELAGYSAEYENDGVIELSDAHLDDKGELILEFDSVGSGDTDVRVTAKTQFDGESDVIEIKNTYSFYVIPSGTIFEVSFGTVNFQSFEAVLLTSLAVLLILLAVLVYSFITYYRNGDFNYKMIACAGLSVFFGVLMLFLAYKWANHALIRFSDAIDFSFDIGYELFLLIAPLMLFLSILLAISNIWLMRHEGYRPVNALGILFAVLWTLGTGIVLYLGVVPVIRDVVMPNLIQRTVLYILCYFGAMFLATVICAYLSTKFKPPYDSDYIIILGCGIRADGTLTPLLKGRVDAALAFEKEQFEKTGKHAIFVPSGGQGEDEVISESRAMANYLIEQGVDEDRILLEDKSVNTIQNMQFSKEVISRHTDDFKNCKIAFATTNYHIFRGYILARKNGYIVKGISAKTKEYFFPNAFLREYVGLLADRKITHILFVLLTLAVFVLIDIIRRQALLSSIGWN